MHVRVHPAQKLELKFRVVAGSPGLRKLAAKLVKVAYVHPTIRGEESYLVLTLVTIVIVRLSE
jgi:hypothetical protein